MQLTLPSYLKSWRISLVFYFEDKRKLTINERVEFSGYVHECVWSNSSNEYYNNFILKLKDSSHAYSMKLLYQFVKTTNENYIKKVNEQIHCFNNSLPTFLFLFGEVKYQSNDTFNEVKQIFEMNWIKSYLYLLCQHGITYKICGVFSNSRYNNDISNVIPIKDILYAYKLYNVKTDDDELAITHLINDLIDNSKRDYEQIKTDLSNDSDYVNKWNKFKEDELKRIDNAVDNELCNDLKQLLISF